MHRLSISRAEHARASSTIPPTSPCAGHCSDSRPIIEAQRRAEEEQTSREQLRAIQRAFREALLALPAEEYDWFHIHARAFRPMSESSAGADRRLPPNTLEEPLPGATEPGEDKRRRQFFEFAGPLFSVAVSPVSSIVRVGATKELRALPRRWWTDKDAGKGHAHGELKSARLVRYFDGKIAEK